MQVKWTQVSRALCVSKVMACSKNLVMLHNQIGIVARFGRP